MYGIAFIYEIIVATHMRTGIKVAIKVLNKERIKQLDMSAKVKREVKILHSFNHPHIVRLYLWILCITV